MATADATPTIAQLVRRLSEGLHELAIAAGQLESEVAGDVDGLTSDQRIALDQAHSNATAITEALDRLGRG